MKKEIKLKVRGFTLMELMIVIAIAAILLTLAVPSFFELINNSKLRSQTNMLLTQLHYSRSEAIRLSDNVIVCRSSDPLASAPSCMGDGADWSTGWIVFQDIDNNNVYDDGTDTLLKVSQNIILSNIKVNASSNDKLIFDSRGNISSDIEFAICDDRDGNGSYEQKHGKEIRISVTGHPVTLTSVNFSTGCVPQ